MKENRKQYTQILYKLSEELYGKDSNKTKYLKKLLNRALKEITPVNQYSNFFNMEKNNIQCLKLFNNKILEDTKNTKEWFTYLTHFSINKNMIQKVLECMGGHNKTLNDLNV